MKTEKEARLINLRDMIGKRILNISHSETSGGSHYHIFILFDDESYGLLTVSNNQYYSGETHLVLIISEDEYRECKAKIEEDRNIAREKNEPRLKEERYQHFLALQKEFGGEG